MGYDINDWEETTVEKIKFSPAVQDSQRIMTDANSNITQEVKKIGLNFLSTIAGYFDGTNFINYFSSTGDAQLRWNNTNNQVVKDTKYEINIDRINGVVELDYHLVLSAADNPSFSIYDASSNLLGTLNLINAGNTNTVTGMCKIVKLTNGYVLNALYSYVKNTTTYNENQNIFIQTKPKFISFGADNSFTYTTESYCKITNK